LHQYENENAIIISVFLVFSAGSEAEQKFALAQSYEQIGDYNSAVKLMKKYTNQILQLMYKWVYRVYTQLKIMHLLTS
jgi:hypothetical protein